MTVPLFCAPTPTEADAWDANGKVHRELSASQTQFSHQSRTDPGAEQHGVPGPIETQERPGARIAPSPGPLECIPVQAHVYYLLRIKSREAEIPGVSG